MKKLFTLVALLACFMGAKAEEVVDYEMDYTTATTWAHGWLNEEEHLVFEPGVGLHFQSTEAQEQFYSFQYQIHPGIQGLDNDASYTITLRIKGTVAQEIHASFSGSNAPGMIPITTDWVELVFENCVNNPNDQYFKNSGCLLIQPGDYVGEFWISYIKITHDEKGSSRPVVWQQWLTNDGNSIVPDVATESKYVGDANTPWPAWALETEGGINANWRGNRTGEICAWALTMGRNFDDQCPTEINSDSYRARPFPADIEADPEDPTNKVFAVHATEVQDIDGGGEGSAAWANQFWIQSPKEWKDGTSVRIKFRYKATKAASVDTQQHKVYPSNYLNSNGVGTINFTTTWQDFEGTLTANTGCVSLAFNLNSGLKEPNDFYFDDLSWETIVLDEGFFVASQNKATGLEYDYENAIEFTQDPNDPEVIVATVGTVGKQDTWVNELMISTVRGNDKAFKGATIKPSGTIKGKDEDNWQYYADGSQYKIELPAAGVWQISIAPADKQILFMQIEGEEIVEKEVVDIVTNDQEIVINAIERQPTSAEQPADEEAGIEAGTGNTWDNQFFLYSNRDLAPGEETVLEFEYKATQQANSSAAFQGIVVGNPDYITGAFDLKDDAAFDTEWKSCKKDLTMPAKKWNGDAVDAVKYITFDLACIKEANTYTFKNIKWYLKSDENEEGKTFENLINATGADNFSIKIGAGTKPYPYGTDPSGIKSVVNTTASDATFNLAGQRVSKNYKGIVVKNGKKSVVK